MSIFDRLRLAFLVFAGEPDHPRWLEQRDEAWSEIDRYRRAAGLVMGEFVGADVTIAKIEERFLKLEATIRKLRRRGNESA